VSGNSPAILLDGSFVGADSIALLLPVLTSLRPNKRLSPPASVRHELEASMSETNLSNRQGRMALSLALLVLLCPAPTKARADVTQLSCIQTGNREYKLSYSFTANTHSVQIFASTSSEPNAPMQFVCKTKRTNIVIRAGNPRQRIYFFFKADSGEMRAVSIRNLPLEGTTNFRDLGRIRDGRRTLCTLGIAVSLRHSDVSDAVRYGIPLGALLPHL
jgi:hypothetical protein